MTRQHWLGIAIALITIVATLMLIMLLDREEAAGAPAFDCFEATERERVRAISLAAMDKGLEQAVSQLYSVWQTGPQEQQPQRAQTGIVHALNVHSRARKFALAWAPPTCP